MERVKEYFVSRQSQELADRIEQLPLSGATVELCAAALQCAPGAVAKALCLIVKNPAKIRYDAVPSTAAGLVDGAAASDGGYSSAAASPVTAVDEAAANLPILILCAGDTKLNQGKYKKIFACPPKMVKKEECLEASGHPVGAVCPFAVAKRTQVFLDVSILRFDRLFPAAGDHRYGLWISPNELQTYADHFQGWVDVCDVVDAKPPSPSADANEA